MKKDAALHSPTAADLYDLRTRHVSSDFPALEKLIAPGSVVLEVGAGTGRVVRFLRTRGCDVVAVERDREKIRILRERFGNDPRVRVVEADFGAGACSEKVDVVLFSFDVFSEFPRIEDRIAALTHAGELLRPNGAIILFNTVITRANELDTDAKFTFPIGDDVSGRYECEITCRRFPLQGVSRCAVRYRPITTAGGVTVEDQFTRALLTRNEQLTLFALHPDVETSSELDAKTLAPVSDQTESIIHVLRKRR